MHQVLDQGGVQIPYFVSEYGPAKWFQAPQTAWGDWVEETPAGKAGLMISSYAAAVNASSVCASENPSLPTVPRVAHLTAAAMCDATHCIGVSGSVTLKLN